MGESLFEYQDADGLELQIYHCKLYDEYFIRVGERIIEVDQNALMELHHVLTQLTESIR